MACKYELFRPLPTTGKIVTQDRDVAVMFTRKLKRPKNHNYILFDIETTSQLEMEKYQYFLVEWDSEGSYMKETLIRERIPTDDEIDPHKYMRPKPEFRGLNMKKFGV